MFDKPTPAQLVFLLIAALQISGEKMADGT